MRLRAQGAAFSLLLAILALSGSPACAGSASIAVAANFTDATRALVKHFEADTGHRITISSGSTGKLYAQIRNGAPYDVFMAADTRRPELLESEGVAVAGSRFTYARGKLVFWSPDPEAFDSPGGYLAEQPFARLAMANPKTAPYGLAARQVLEHLELWLTLQPKLVRGESIAQAFQFIASGNASAGFVALAQIKAWNSEPGSIWHIPQAYYEPVDQQVVLLERGKTNEAATAWLLFLRSPAATDIILDYGYDITD